MFEGENEKIPWQSSTISARAKEGTARGPHRYTAKRPISNSSNGPAYIYGAIGSRHSVKRQFLPATPVSIYLVANYTCPSPGFVMVTVVPSTFVISIENGSV